MQDLGKGCAYAKFYYDTYKTDWVYNFPTSNFYSSFFELREESLLPTKLESEDEN